MVKKLLNAHKNSVLPNNVLLVPPAENQFKTEENKLV